MFFTIPIIFFRVIILFLLFLLRWIGGVTLSKQCKAFSQLLWERIAVLAEVDFYSERLVCIQAVLFHFINSFGSGSQGWNPLASCVSEHSNLRFCNAEIPSLLGLKRHLSSCTNLYFVSLRIIIYTVI